MKEWILCDALIVEAYLIYRSNDRLALARSLYRSKISRFTFSHKYVKLRKRFDTTTTTVKFDRSTLRRIIETEVCTRATKMALLPKRRARALLRRRLVHVKDVTSRICRTHEKRYICFFFFSFFLLDTVRTQCLYRINNTGRHFQLIHFLSALLFYTYIVILEIKYASLFFTAFSKFSTEARILLEDTNAKNW